jgi:hypothetical protein
MRGMGLAGYFVHTESTENTEILDLVFKTFMSIRSGKNLCALCEFRLHLHLYILRSVLCL